MKNKLLAVLPVLTALFVGLTLGLYLGRNPTGSSVTVSIPEQQAATISPSDHLPQPSEQQGSLSVNINTADASELAQLPGIGEVLARRIIDYRRIHGAFTAPEQLTNVEGVGQGKLEAILEQISIGG